MFAVRSFQQPSGSQDCVNVTGYTIYGFGDDPPDSLDAGLNWWRAASGAGDAVGRGIDATTAPWISQYTDAAGHSYGFWPLVGTQTAITSATPEPSPVGVSYTVSGTVEVTGLGGVTANLPALPGQVVVSDGSESCTATTLSDSGTLNQAGRAVTVPTPAPARTWSCPRARPACSSLPRTSPTT